MHVWGVEELLLWLVMHAVDLTYAVRVDKICGDKVLLLGIADRQRHLFQWRGADGTPHIDE